MAQKVLYGVIIALLVLMVLFSFLSLQNQGQKGFEKCIEKRCEEGGEARCTKTREINNCCLGAGGKLANQNGKLICNFS